MAEYVTCKFCTSLCFVVCCHRKAGSSLQPLFFPGSALTGLVLMPRPAASTTSPRTCCSLLESFCRAGRAQQRSVFACSLAGAGAASSAALAYLWDHQVSGRPVFPGAGYFEMAGAAAATLAAAGSSGSSAAAEAGLADVAIVAPLLLPQPAAGSSTVILQASFGAGDGTMEVASLQGDSRRSKPSVHVDGCVVVVGASQQRTTRQAGVHASQQATFVSPAKRLLALTLQQRQPAAFAELARACHDDSAVVVSPAVLDCCLQLAAVPGTADSKLRIPAGAGLLLLGSRAVPEGKSSGCVALSRPSGAGVAPAGSASEATFTDYCLASSRSGNSVCRVSGMEARPMGSAAPPRLPAAARRAVAAQAAAAAAAGAAQPASRGSAGQLQQGEWLYSLEWLTHASSGSAAAEAAASAVSAAEGAMQLGATGTGAAGAAAAAIAVGQQAVAGSLHSVGLLTRGAQQAAAAGPAGSSTVQAVQAAGLWAFARTMAQELSSFQVQALDLPQQAATGRGQGPTMLAAPAGSKGGRLPSASQLGGTPYGHAVQGGSLVAATLQHSAVKPMLPAFQLFPQPRGALQNLAPLPVDTASPLAPGQVLVAVKAVGINFR